MEMQLKGNEFWVLEYEGDRRIFDDLNDAVKAVKALMENDVEPDNITLVAVDVGEKDWKIKQVPWSEIAVRLVKIK